MEKRILLLYSNPDIKQTLDEMVRPEGFSIFPLTDKDKVLPLLTVDPHFDLLMIQTEAVDEGHLALIQELKQGKEKRILPVILLLDENNIADQLSILEIGADDFILIPINPILMQLKLRILTHFLEMKHEMLEMKSQLMVFREMQKIVTTISHYMNNALTPIINLNTDTLNLSSDKLNQIILNRVKFLAELIDLFQKIVTQKNFKTVDEGVYKGLLVDLEDSVRQLKDKYKIK